MRIEWFEAKGFNHLSLNNIETIRLTPEKKFHWILGTNGSGKSSLLSQLTPLTATPQDYAKGGHKKIQILSDKGRFRLESDFSGPKNKFSVVRVLGNGQEEELNPGHTSTVADNLVQQLFGVNQDTHKLSLGKLRFCDMVPTARKYWLTKLSDTDYSYALEYFKKLVGHYRDILGSIKVDQNRLTELRGRLLGPDEEKVLLEEVAILQQQIENIRNLMPRPDMSWDQFRFEVNRLNNELKNSLTKMRARLRAENQALPLPTITRLSEELANAEAEQRFLKDMTVPLYAEFEAISKKISQGQQTEGLDINSLMQDHALGMKKMEELEGLVGPIEIKDPDLLIFKFDNFRATLELVIGQMTADPELSYHYDGVKELSERLQAVQQSLFGTNTAIEMIRRQIHEAESHRHHDKTTCPKCKHQWNPLFEESKLEELHKTLQGHLAGKLKTEASIDSLSEELNEHNLHFQGVSYFQNMLGEFPDFHAFFKPLIDNKMHRKHPETLSLELNNFRHRIDAAMEMSVLSNALREKEGQIRMLRHQEAVNLQALLDRQKEIEVRIQANFDQRSTMAIRIQKLASRKELSEFLTKTETQAKEIKERLTKLGTTGFENLQKGFLEDYLLELTKQSLEKSKLVRSVENQRHEVDSLESVISDNQEYAKGLRVVVDSLSPKEGLIAKGLTGFINHFTKMMNGLIGKIWLYPMNISPIEIDDQNGVDLDYKFAVEVNGKMVKDISLCSTGQQEIINLAFLIVALTFLRLDKGPLFLDEFAAHMDMAHRASAFNMISNMLATSNFSQVFMVSHFEDSFSNALDSDITVLCKANIQLPDGLVVNQQTIIN